ncbi:MAG: helix-turn-helix domain-containing protein [Deltaproteobacteria bacterium]|nr:helix-turn-helix domain-containing protein [Deltaproteobacteria bacterium]
MPRRLSPTELARAELARRNLLRFRGELGFSAAVVADRAQIPVDTYRQLEKGTRRLTNISVLIDLARALGHPVDDFFHPKPPSHRPELLALIGARILPGSHVDADIWADVEGAVASAERKQRRRKRRK